MVYNYSREKNKWEHWKKQEEKLLRSLNVDENTIKELRQYDWNALVLCQDFGLHKYEKFN